MAINKKLIHFNKKATFNSQKLSANDSNTQYQVGGTGTVQTGAPDINYQSIVYIKDSKEIWTHGQFYATAVTWSTITGKPSFATVATSGSYNDLSDKPTIPTSSTEIVYLELPTDFPYSETTVTSSSMINFLNSVCSHINDDTIVCVTDNGGKGYTVVEGIYDYPSSPDYKGFYYNGYHIYGSSSNPTSVSIQYSSDYTLPTASSTTLGGIKVGDGFSISSGVLSVAAPEPVNHEWYKLVGYKSGNSLPLRGASALTYRTSNIAGTEYSNLLIGDNDDDDGPGSTTALWLTTSSNRASISGEHSAISVEAQFGDVALIAGEGGGVHDVILQPSGVVKIIGQMGNTTAQIETEEDSDNYSIFKLSTGNSTGTAIAQMTLGGINKSVNFFGPVNSPGGFFDTSDARVKTNVKEIDVKDADAIKLVEFDRTDIEHHGYGVIAQEVEKIYPSVVNTDADGFKSVNYNEIAMIKIKSLEDKVAKLEALVAKLESKLS